MVRVIGSPPGEQPPRAWRGWPGGHGRPGWHGWRRRPAHTLHTWRTWPFGRVRLEWVDVAWGVFSLANLLAMLLFARWETVPFHFIWISLTLLYGFRVWAAQPTAWVLGLVMLATFAAILLDVSRGTEPVDELNEVPLMAAMFAVMVWHAQRRLAADRERQRMGEENMRLLAAQRRFLQDASHQLRTPITIALGHAELLARELNGKPEASDIEVVVGELSRLRRIGERLLVIAASEDPGFLRLEPVALDEFTMEVIRRWRPAAQRRWQLGRLDEVAVVADRERLGLAVDALIENAVRHTGTRDVIKLAAISPGDANTAAFVITDSGGGIPAAELAHIFDRFGTGAGPAGSRGTGLGLALARAIARAHGGDIRVRSTVGTGSEFELVLPAVPEVPAVPAVPEAGSERPGEDAAAEIRDSAWLPGPPPPRPQPEEERDGGPGGEPGEREQGAGEGQGKMHRIRQRMRQ